MLQIFDMTGRYPIIRQYAFVEHVYSGSRDDLPEWKLSYSAPQ